MFTFGVEYRPETHFIQGGDVMIECLWAEEDIHGQDICIIRSRINGTLVYCDRIGKDKENCSNYSKGIEEEEK